MKFRTLKRNKNEKSTCEGLFTLIRQSTPYSKSQNSYHRNKSGMFLQKTNNEKQLNANKSADPVLIAIENLDTVNDKCVNSYGETHLIYTMRQSTKSKYNTSDFIYFTKIAESLIEHDTTTLNTKDMRGMTALMWAIYSKCTSIVDTLLEQKIDVNIQDNKKMTALMHACSTGITDRTKIVKALLDHGADVNIKNKDKYTVLDILYNDYIEPDYKQLIELIEAKGGKRSMYVNHRPRARPPPPNVTSLSTNGAKMYTTGTVAMGLLSGGTRRKRRGTSRKT